ncbi:MAG: PepSY-like domain-containing protein [Chitinophagaceae bacterium]|nr:PepSY-like domain-containing protein [Chitinophagaceae bacterium]
MKKLFVLLAITGFASFAATAQHLKESQVPSKVKLAFQKSYPKTMGKWEMEDHKYEVNFKHEGQTMSAVIDKMGNITETETDIAIKQLPVAISDYVMQHYKGAKITEASAIKKGGGEMNYEARVKGKDVIFDANGKFIKEVKD